MVNRTRCVIALAGAVALSPHAYADTASPTSAVRHRETARWWSLGATLASLTIAGAGAAMLDYGRTHPDTTFTSRLRLDGSWLIGLGAASTLITPAFGEWYAGEAITGGLVLRGTGIGIGLIGLAAYFLSGTPEGFGQTYVPHDPVPATVLFSIGGAAYLGGMIYDIVRAPGAVDRSNARHVMLVPTAVASASGVAPGVGLRATF